MKSVDGANRKLKPSKGIVIQILVAGGHQPVEIYKVMKAVHDENSYCHLHWLNDAINSLFHKVKDLLFPNVEHLCSQSKLSESYYSVNFTTVH